MTAYAENYCALALCILTNMVPEQAFRRAGCESPETKTQQRKRETAEMLDLRRKGFTYEQIGQLYGVRQETVWKRLKKYQEVKAFE